MIISSVIKIQNRLTDILMQWWNVRKLYSFNKQVVLQRNGEYRIIGSFYLRLKKNSKLILGNNLTISSGLCYNPISRNIRTSIFAEENAKITIGDNVGMSGACLWASQSINIGNNVKIGGDSVLIDSDCHSLDCRVRRTKNDKLEKVDKPIIVEDDVLIGARCIILKGVKIGARSIIGAGSVVTKSIPADCVAAGNPCKVIKYTNI